MLETFRKVARTFVKIRKKLMNQTRTFICLKIVPVTFLGTFVTANAFKNRSNH